MSQLLPLKKSSIMKFRVGLGFDVHALEAGREFYLGGIKLPANRGAVGHSDADVLIHAICDALLGAANLRDIGHHYSNKDPRWRGMDSKFFLKDVTRMLTERGWEIENVDCTVCLEAPKVNPHIDEMKKVLAVLMNISEEDVSIKATTNERLGYVGREEGVNAMAVALIRKEH
ncbi:MAG: 2-C-methyl-D-erythritol 2,4-cyclodiphosphate synthase [Bacteroidetes bacterium OLB12]|nr:MAG: 2-C-methyl-D-erythritol 2,4-cyclodiphosphate synthase [Bacteroidetes bacterium OLB12]